MKDFPLSEQEEFVEVLDGSGAFLIETFEHIYGSNMRNRAWRIIGFEPLESPPFYGIKRYKNDCIIESVDDARQKVSIQSRFLRPLTKHCPTCKCDHFTELPRDDFIS